MALDPSELKILKNTKFPPEFNQKVEIKKVNLEVLKQYYLARCAEMMGDDDIAPEWGWQTLTTGANVNIKPFQIKMTGFLAKNAAKFSKELWALFLSAQENPNGVPPQLLEAKKEELLKQREERERRENELQLRQAQDREREQDTERRRRSGREERGRGRGGYSRGDDRRSSFGGRNDRGYEGNRGFESRRDSRDDRPTWREDPTRRGRDGFRGEGGRRGSSGRYSDRRSRSRSPPRTMDSYKPSSRRARSPSPRRRSRSPSRSRSRSRNNRRYRSRSPSRSNHPRRRNSSSSRLSVTPLRSVSRALTDSRPNSSSGPGPAGSRRGSAGSFMSTSSSKLSEKGKQKLADFAKEKDARRASFSAETGGPIEGK